MNLQQILCLIGLQSTTRPPVEVASTGPRITRQDAVAMLSFAAHRQNRIPVLAALMRWAPDLVSDSEQGEVRRALMDHLAVYALTQRPRLPDAKLPADVRRAAHTAMAEHSQWTPCGTCNGSGTVYTKAAAGVAPVTCPACNGARYIAWSDRGRARFMGLSLATAQHCRLDLVKHGVALLASWQSEGETAIRRNS